MIYPIIILVVLILIIVYVLKRKTILHYSNMEYDISDITKIEKDQCVNHYEVLLPLDTERCKIKFKPYNKHSKKNIERHNNGEICLSACTLHYSQRIEILYGMLKFIIDFFNKHSVEWCFYYGGLVGLYTRNELLPWDPDIDILINDKFIKNLPSVYDDEFYSFNIHFPKDNEDIIGRFIDKNNSMYSDITYYTPTQSTVLVKKMPTIKNPEKFMEIPNDKFYPLVQKSFKNGITVPVPSDIQYNLEKRYGKIKDDFRLVGDKYVRI